MQCQSYIIKITVLCYNSRELHFQWKRRLIEIKDTNCGRKSEKDDDNNSYMCTFCDDYGRKLKYDTSLKCVKFLGH